MSSDFLHSSYRERLLEYLFMGQVLRQLWLDGVPQVEVLRSEVDGAGYDIVLESDSVVRHVQLKSSRLGAKRANVDIHIKLAEKPSGCVVWMYFDPDTVELGPFLWLGGSPGEPLPDLSVCRPARHAKADATGKKAKRPNLRRVPKGQFTKFESVGELVHVLFGPATDM